MYCDCEKAVVKLRQDKMRRRKDATSKVSISLLMRARSKISQASMIHTKSQSIPYWSSRLIKRQ